MDSGCPVPHTINKCTNAFSCLSCLVAFCVLFHEKGMGRNSFSRAFQNESIAKLAVAWLRERRCLATGEVPSRCLNLPGGGADRRYGRD